MFCSSGSPVYLTLTFFPGLLGFLGVFKCKNHVTFLDTRHVVEHE